MPFGDYLRHIKLYLYVMKIKPGDLVMWDIAEEFYSTSELDDEPIGIVLKVEDFQGLPSAYVYWIPSNSGQAYWTPIGFLRVLEPN